jgi:centriolar protein POC1
MIQVSTLSGHQNPIYAVKSHPSKPVFYSGGNDKGIVEWELNSNVHTRVFSQVKATVYALEVIDAKNLLLAGCNNGDLLFIDLENFTLLKSIKLSSAIFNIKYIEAKDEILISTDKGIIYIVALNQYEIVHQFAASEQKIRSFAVNAALNTLTIVANDEMISFYSLDDYAFINQIKGHDMGTSALAYDPENKYLITGGRDANLKIWDLENLSCIKEFPAHLFAIYRIIYHPYLPYFATASRDKSIKIWRGTDFSLFKNLSKDKGYEGHRLSVNDICWSGDGKKLLSVSDDKMVKVWDLDFS